MADIGDTNDLALALDEPKGRVGYKTDRQSDAPRAIGQAGKHSVEVAMVKCQDKGYELLSTLGQFGNEASIRVAEQ